ncbi:CAP domain-containing protein [Erythrobacter sp. WG]|uniref:CAP domain-containing protein n=1 Tax=Erythrobacter sp. WG TaxID=2985510 RepID=UPI0022710120|nr:CAP domain-containing protein [Erythrobacter sp. WG]MCX9146221.1 CAP domain-containing protein [Erythrobacter sp. WG]
MFRVRPVTLLACLGGLGLSMAAAPALPQASRVALPVEREALAAHNMARVEAGAVPLIWSERLARDAQGWADGLAAQGRFDHAPPGQRRGQGENLWRGTRGRWSVEAMIGFFLDERRFFRAGTFPDISATGRWSDVGHYSQIIWPDTREVGCALARTPSDEVLVCRYWPAGNVWGQRIEARPRLSRR